MNHPVIHYYIVTYIGCIFFVTCWGTMVFVSPNSATLSLWVHGGSWQTVTLLLSSCAAATAAFLSRTVSSMLFSVCGPSKFSWLLAARIITGKNFSPFALRFCSSFVTVSGVAPPTASTWVLLYRPSSRSRMIELPTTRTGQLLGDCSFEGCLGWRGQLRGWL